MVTMLGFCDRDCSRLTVGNIVLLDVFLSSHGLIGILILLKCPAPGDQIY
jgi:hypothetical protein